MTFQRRNSPISGGQQTNHPVWHKQIKPGPTGAQPRRTWGVSPMVEAPLAHSHVDADRAVANGKAQTACRGCCRCQYWQVLKRAADCVWPGLGRVTARVGRSGDDQLGRAAWQVVGLADRLCVGRLHQPADAGRSPTLCWRQRAAEANVGRSPGQRGASAPWWKRRSRSPTWMLIGPYPTASGCVGHRGTRKTFVRGTSPPAS